MARRIWLAVKPHSKVELVCRKSDTELCVSVNVPASQGKANRRVIELLADYFHTAKSNIHIVQGHKSKHKLVEIDSL